jgi:hypothetical protein
MPSISQWNAPSSDRLSFLFFWLSWVFGLVGYWIGCLTVFLFPCSPDTSEVGEMPPLFLFVLGCHWLCKGLARRLTVYSDKLIPCSLSLALAGPFPSLPPTLSSTLPPPGCSTSRLVCNPPSANCSAVALSATVVACDRTGGSGSLFGCLGGFERGWGVVVPSLKCSLGYGFLSWGSDGF